MWACLRLPGSLWIMAHHPPSYGSTTEKRGDKSREEERKGKKRKIKGEENCERNQVILHPGSKTATYRRQSSMLKKKKFIWSKIRNETKKDVKCDYRHQCWCSGFQVGRKCGRGLLVLLIRCLGVTWSCWGRGCSRVPVEVNNKQKYQVETWKGKEIKVKEMNV